MSQHSTIRFNKALNKAVAWANKSRPLLASRLNMSPQALSEFIIKGELPIRKAIIVAGWLKGTKHEINWQDLCPKTSRRINEEIEHFKTHSV